MFALGTEQRSLQGLLGLAVSQLFLTAAIAMKKDTAATVIANVARDNLGEGDQYSYW